MTYQQHNDGTVTRHCPYYHECGNTLRVPEGSKSTLCDDCETVWQEKLSKAEPSTRANILFYQQHPQAF